MKGRRGTVPGTLVRDRRRVAADLIALTKPRVVLMVAITTLVGYYVGLAGPADYARLVHLLIGTMLAAGGTLALNQYWERDVDARMERTRHRPLPEGRLDPAEALAFGLGLTASGIVYLALLVNALAAAVTAATALLYVLAYTPLKLRTPLCTLVGAVPGAAPPLTGWAGAREDLALGAWVLFAILFLWQIPHTLAIGRLHDADYARAGIRVLAVVDAGGHRTERQILTGSLALLAASLAPWATGLTGSLYAAGALVLGAGLVAMGVMQARVPSPAHARRVLVASLLYLPALFALLALDKM